MKSAGFLVVYTAVLCLALTGCAHTGADAPARPLSATTAAVVLWVDATGCADIISDRALADQFCVSARRSGVTHLAIEARGAAGNMILAEQEALVSSASSQGLRLLLLLPMFIAEPGDPKDSLAWRGTWSGNGWDSVAMDGNDGLPARTSAASPSIRQRELAMLAALAEDPRFEGILLSGMGFHDQHSDIGPSGRQAFQAWSGVTPRQWPEDVFGTAPPARPFGSEGRGPLWETWVTWRAATIADFLVQVRAVLHNADTQPPPALGVIVDAPWPAHFREGFNWSHPSSPTESDHPWIPVGYGNSGGGHLLDVTVLAFWEPEILDETIAEENGFAWWASMDGSLAMALRYRQSPGRTWALVPVWPDTSWGNTVRHARRRMEGVVLLPASAYIQRPERWEILRLALRPGI